MLKPFLFWHGDTGILLDEVASDERKGSDKCSVSTDGNVTKKKGYVAKKDGENGEQRSGVVSAMRGNARTGVPSTSPREVPSESDQELLS